MKDLGASGISHPFLQRSNSIALSLSWSLEEARNENFLLVTPSVPSKLLAAHPPKTIKVGSGEDE